MSHALVVLWWANRVIPYKFSTFFHMTPLRFGVWVVQLDLFSPMKFEHHQLYSFSKMEDQNIALCAVYYSRTHDCINPHNLAIFDGFEKRIAVPKARRMSFHVIFYMASFDELANSHTP